MPFVAINAIDVPTDKGDEMAARFAARAGQVDKQEGFEEFQLLRPADDRGTWLVYTRWRDKESFDAWVSSMAFGQGHAKPEGGVPGEGGSQGDKGPVASGSSLWQFTVEQRSMGA